MEMKRLNQIMPEILDNTFNIFSILDSFEVPWAEMNISEELYIDYMCNISGNKIISNLLENVVTGNTITEGELIVIMRLIYSMYGEKWLKIWQVLQSEYNPINNYDMVETMNNDETEYAHGKTTTRTNALTMTKEGTEKTDPGSNKTESNSVYGFNSVESVPVDNKETAFTGEDTVTYDLEEGNNGTVTDVDSGTDTQTRNYTLNRSGNIGVTTTQEMIKSEIDLRVLHDYFRSIVYPDLNRVLTIEVY